MLMCAWQGMERLVDYDYIAIFDADFKPDPEFLVGDYSSCCAHAVLPCMLHAGDSGRSHQSGFLCITQASSFCDELGTPCTPDDRGTKCAGECGAVPH